eukprot:TRINITY_DN2274_c1_g1_i1.p1 TRINITY_DN2274_c1_g1~~TRINITY_DN2274_c1_g1_i1.p1  ORF type:complete len:669 (+),score=115.78 TRINITY_DN2274_c1_g1_i1:532-2538(+)
MQYVCTNSNIPGASPALVKFVLALTAEKKKAAKVHVRAPQPLAEQLCRYIISHKTPVEEVLQLSVQIGHLNGMGLSFIVPQIINLIYLHDRSNNTLKTWLLMLRDAHIVLRNRVPIIMRLFASNIEVEEDVLRLLGVDESFAAYIIKDVASVINHKTAINILFWMNRKAILRSYDTIRVFLAALGHRGDILVPALESELKHALSFLPSSSPESSVPVTEHKRWRAVRILYDMLAVAYRKLPKEEATYEKVNELMVHFKANCPNPAEVDVPFLFLTEDKLFNSLNHSRSEFNPEKVFETYYESVKQQLRPSNRMNTLVIQAYLKVGNINRSLELIDWMVREHLDIKGIYAIIIDHHLRASNPQKAIDYLEEVHRTGYHVTIDDINCFIQYYASMNAFKTAEDFLRGYAIPKYNVTPNEATFDALIKYCSLTGLHEKAYQYYQEVANLVTHHTCVPAERVLRNMGPEDAVKIKAIANDVDKQVPYHIPRYQNILLDAYYRSGLRFEAEVLYRRMQFLYRIDSTTHYIRLVHSTDMDSAIMIFTDAINSISNFRKRKHVYCGLVVALSKYGDYGLSTAEKMLEESPYKGTDTFDLPYFDLILEYSNRGNHKKVEELLELCRSRGVYLTHDRLRTIGDNMVRSQYPVPDGGMLLEMMTNLALPERMVARVVL